MGVRRHRVTCLLFRAFAALSAARARFGEDGAAERVTELTGAWNRLPSAAGPCPGGAVRS